MMPDQGQYGNMDVEVSVSTSPNRRAIPVTFNQAAVIESISIYHDGGTGDVLMGVYADQDGEPSIKLGASASTAIKSSEGWQTVSLKSTVAVNPGQTIWLSWVFENNPGIRYSTGTPGRAESSATWSSGMTSSFGTSTFENYNYSVYCTYSTDLTAGIIGNAEVYNGETTAPNRRTISVTSSESGTIESISIYHNGGTGKVLLGVYSDQSGLPSSLLGLTAPTTINSSEGWQTVSLESPVFVNSGQTVWLSWVFENNPGVRYSIGKPGRAQSTGTWSSGMPLKFGSSSFADYNYSVYCSFMPNKPVLKGAEIPEVVKNAVAEPAIPAAAVTDNIKQDNSFVEINGNQFDNLDFKLYPNPAKSVINIDLMRISNGDATIVIIDNSGRTVYNQRVESSLNTINISQFNVGLYFVKLISQQMIITKKLIITN